MERRKSVQEEKFVSISKLEFSYERLTRKKFTEATLPELIVKLVTDREDSELEQSLLTVHSIICTPELLLQYLIDLYEHPKIKYTDVNSDLGESDRTVQRTNSGRRLSQGETLMPTDPVSSRSRIRLNVANLIKTWIRMFYDFYANPVLMEMVSELIDKLNSRRKKTHTLPLNILEEAKNIYEQAVKVHESRKVYPSVKALNPQPVLPILGGKLTLDHIAQQLTALEYNLLRDIRPYDIINHRQWHESGKKHSREVQNYINHFRDTRQFFIAEIVRETSVRSCATLIKRAVAIAKHCFAYRNYNSLMEILSALCSPRIIFSETAKAWELVDAKVLKDFETLSEYISPEENFRNYRKLLESSPIPSVPYLGLHIGDIRFLDDFNRTTGVEGYNIRKLKQFNFEIQKLRGFFAGEYPFTLDDEFAERFVENFCHSSELVKKPNFFAKLSSEEISPRLQFLRDQYENCYSDANVIGKEELNFNTLQLRPRDWNLLSTSGTPITYPAGTILQGEGESTNDLSVVHISSGTIEFSKGDVVLKRSSGHMIIGGTSLLSPMDNPYTVCAATECKGVVIDKQLLITVLESDSDISVRFFSNLAFQLIELLQASRADVTHLDSSTPRLMRISRDNSFKLHLPYVVKPLNPGSSNLLQVDPHVGRDVKFRLLFDLGPNEVLIKEYRASMLQRTGYSQGTLYIAQHYLCFAARLFNYKTKYCLPYSSIADLTLKSKKKIIIDLTSTRRKRSRCIVKVKEAVEVFNLLLSLKNSGAPEQVGARLSLPKLHSHFTIEDWNNTKYPGHSLALTSSDWDLILRGAKRVTFKKNDVIISEGSDFQRIFQVVRGSCRIEKTLLCSSQSRLSVVGTLGSSEILGEISFFQKSGATASVIADTDEVELCIIEGYYVKRLMQMRSELAGRFLHYVCSVIQRRLIQQDRYEDQDERRVVDIVAEPIHQSLTRVPVVPPTSLEPITSLIGPEEIEDDEYQKFISSATSFCCATSISTYPMLQIFQDDPEVPPVWQREGSPICDQYGLLVYPTRVIVAVADGCNWGDPPRDAARSARNAFLRYMSNHQGDIRDIQHAGGLVLRAMAMAHAEIFKGVDTENSLIGTTTLLGGILLELDRFSVEDDDGFLDSKDIPTFGFVYCSVGDCKAFHWNSLTGEFTDITQANRVGSLSASDCGGRLGPANAGNMPDLRNLELGLFPCCAGDYFILVSDGVHDNLDPTHLGFQPRDFDIECDSWENVTDVDILENCKNTHRLRLFEKIIFNNLDATVRKRTTSVAEARVFKPIPSPLETVQCLVNYCKETCKAASEWMSANPKSRLPKDYRLYPGKMDHTTCVCFVVGEKNL